MANTIVQLRRSNTSATPGTTLFAGELAYSYNTASQGLFIGSNSGVGTAGIRIGGFAYSFLHQANTGTPGAQAANSTVLTDGNSFVYNVFSQGLLLGASVSGPAGNNTVAFVSSISNTGNSTQIGANASGGGIGTELVTSAAISAYVLAKVSGATVSGSNTQIQFNNSAAFGSNTNFTFDFAATTLNLGNTTAGTIKLGTGGANVIFATDLLVQANSTVNSIVNATAHVIQSNSTVNTTITPTTIYSGNSTINLSWASSKLVLNGATNVDATSAMLKIQQGIVTGNLLVQGNLSVTGTLFSIDSTNIVVQDPVLVINDGGSTTDTADLGFVGYFGNSTVTQVAGLVRKSAAAAAGYSNTFVLFTSQTAFTNTTSTVPLDANLQIATLQSWLYSSANSSTTGKFVSNTTGLTITANSTWAVGITANTLSLTTPLPITSGGVGVGTVAAGGILLGNTTSAMVVLSPAANGTILQILNSAGSGPENIVGYAGIDGGSF